MRLSILAFACGIALLQMQSELPGSDVTYGLFGLALAGVFLSAKRTYWPFRVLLLMGCALLGFAWAGWMAQQRLAEQLPVAWEARDIELTGVVASLPQRFERGERFEFDVDSVRTKGAVVPGRIMLSWYHSWDDLADAEVAGDANEARAVHPGERRTDASRRARVILS